MSLAQFSAHYDNGLAQFNASFSDGTGDIILNGQPTALLLGALPGDLVMGAAQDGVIHGIPASLVLSGVPGAVVAGGAIPPPPPLNTEFAAWLRDPAAIRCLLVEVAVNDGAETVRYLSSRPYRSAGSDTPANTVYRPLVIGSSVRTVERMSLSAETASLSFGDIELSNTDGELDDWLFDVWSNRPIRVYLGDVRWERADYQVVFDGVVEDIGSRARDTLNLKLRDKLQRLNTPVTDAVLGGSTQNKNQLIPLTFGECHNISPLLTNPATLEYQVHGGAVEHVIEVRDNGVPVAANVNLGAGKFTLPVQPFGRITASVQGDKHVGTWRQTARQIIERLVTAYGEPNSRFISEDLDTAQLDAFDAANSQPLGVYLSSRENVLNLCNRIAASVGARLVMSRLGKLRLIKLALPAPGTPFAIGPDDVMLGTLRVAEKLPVQAGIKIGFCRNWTVQDPLDTRIPSGHKDLYAREWLTTTASDANTKTDYRLDGEPEQIDSFLLTEADAGAESGRLLDLYKSPRYVITFTAPARLLQLEVGQAVTITCPRFGLDNGKNGMVIGLSPDWDRAILDVEVLI